MEYNELVHWGVKGMKWGVRRYQNKDGSLTPAGKKRYDRWSDDAKTASDISKKKVKEMTNAELRKLNERTQLENQYRQLNPSTVSKGIKFMTTAAAITGTALNLYNNSDRLVKLGRTVGDGIVKAAGNMLMKDLNRRLGA